MFRKSWKLLREYLILHGIQKDELNSPRNILKRGYTLGFISKEKDWLDALKWHNDTTHQYSESIARQLVNITNDRFIDMFREIVKLTNTVIE